MPVRLPRAVSVAALLVALPAMAFGQAPSGPEAAASGAAASGTPTGGSSLNELVVTAARAERPVSAIPGSVIVIERAQIERQMALTSDPARILAKLIPGYSPRNDTISNASETFRGRSVLVMVDGVPRNTPLRDVSRITSLIDINNIERIEVVNGASSLYGSGATGGTINFITRKATGGAPSVTVNTALRAFTHKPLKSLAPEASVSVSGDAEAFDYVATLSGKLANRAYDGRGRELPSDPMMGQGGGDRFRDGNGAIKLGRSFGADRVEIFGEWTYFEQEPDYMTDYLSSPVRPDKSKPYVGRNTLENSRYLSASYTAADFLLGRLEVKGYRNDIKKRFSFADIGPGNPAVYYSGNPLAPVSRDGQTTSDVQRTGVTATVDTPLGGLIEGLRLTWGGDYVFDETRQYYQDKADAIAPMTQHSFAAFGQLELPVTDWLMMRGGVRYEHFRLKVKDFTRPVHYYAVGGRGALVPAREVSGGTFNYDQATFNIGAVVALDSALEAYGGFSQGFALPDVGSFTRRAGFDNPFASTPIDYSDIGPKAQLVNNYELGLRGDWGRYRATLSGYVSTSDRGVNFDTLANRMVQQKERVYGVEFTGEVEVTEALRLGTVLSWREGKRDTDGNGSLDAYLPNNRISTPFRGMLYGEYGFDFDLAVRAELEHFGGRDRDDGTTRQKIGSATTVNLSAGYPLLGGQFSVGVQNLFDVTYDNPTATATRNLPVTAFGRVISMGYSRRF